jgi:hypothetical protein
MALIKTLVNAANKVGKGPARILFRSTAAATAAGTVAVLMLIGGVVYAAPHSAATVGFVHVCGAQVCLGSQPYVIHGATAYGAYDQPAKEIALAQAGNINTLELAEFDAQYHQLPSSMSSATWTRVDKFVAAAGRAGLHVILNLSEYGQSLQAVGQTPTTANWINYLSFIANRTNTVTGVQYKNDPTIAMVEIFGEICSPGARDSSCPAGTSGTANEMQSFFHRTETQWHALAPNIMISTGGFSHLDNATSSGIPWQKIVSDPTDATCDIEINSASDVDNSIAKFTSYCKKIGKPWFLSAWSSCYHDTGYPFYLATDGDMAAHAREMYGIQQGRSQAAMPAIGSDFWNLKDSGVAPSNCDLGPAYPQTWSVIQNA